jgi:hypothetical protein
MARIKPTTPVVQVGAPTVLNEPTPLSSDPAPTTPDTGTTIGDTVGAHAEAAALAGAAVATATGPFTHEERVAALRVIWKAVKELDKQKLSKIRDGGNVLKEIKIQGGHGGWEIAVAKVGMGQSTANRWMDVADYWTMPNFPRAGSLRDAEKFISAWRKEHNLTDGRSQRKKKAPTPAPAPTWKVTLAKLRSALENHQLEDEEDRITSILEELGADVEVESEQPVEEPEAELATVGA